MKLFKRSNSASQAIPEDLQPYYASQNSGMAKWLGPVLRGLLLIVVLALLIWAGIWLFHKLTKSGTAKTSSNQTSQSTQKTGQLPRNSANDSPASPKNKPAPKSSPTPTPSPTVVPNPTPPPASASRPTTPPAVTPNAAITPSTTGQLSNTGPGDIVLLFVVSLITSAVMYRYYLVRSLTAK